MEAVVPKIFLVGAVLGAIGCLARADYNLPIFLFAYIAWSYLNVRADLTKEPKILCDHFVPLEYSC